MTKSPPIFFEKKKYLFFFVKNYLCTAIYSLLSIKNINFAAGKNPLWLQTRSKDWRKTVKWLKGDGGVRKKILSFTDKSIYIKVKG